MSSPLSLPKLASSALFALPLLGAFGGASATVLQDRYRGHWSTVPGITQADQITPNYDNRTIGGLTGLDNLLAHAASEPVDAASTFSSQLFHHPWAPASPPADPPLCASAGQAACNAQYKGLLGYAVLKFPATGTYRFYGVVDDQMAVFISSLNSTTAQSTPVNPRWNAMYKAVADLNGTAVDRYAALGGDFHAEANACLMVRVAWNNAWGASRLGLGWMSPGSPSPAGELYNNTAPLIPATQWLDPTSDASFAGCTFPISAHDKTGTTPADTPLTLTHDITTGWGAAVGSARLLTDAEALHDVHGVNGFVAQNGTVACDAAGCTYTPNAGFTGEDRFTYQVCTAAAVAPATAPLCDTATVTVTVTAAATPPAPPPSDRIASVPTLGPWMLSALAVVLGGLGMARRRSSR